MKYNIWIKIGDKKAYFAGTGYGISFLDACRNFFEKDVYYDKYTNTYKSYNIYQTEKDANNSKRGDFYECSQDMDN
ncbi:MAG: hypothetical protein PVJ67_03805 [Candidatus Pacearchaeota archaeon]|jgi:hypothetical protein